MDEVGPPTPAREGRRLHAAEAVPTILLTAAFFIGLFAPGEITPTPLLAATPAVALGLCAMTGIVVTVVATVAVSSTILAVHFSQGKTFTAFVVEYVSVLVVCGTCLVLGAYKRRARDKFETLTVVAETVQRAVLPPAPSRIGRFRLAVNYRPAYSDALVGGDAYAVEHTSHGVRLMIADVRGKGLGAIRIVAALTGAFRTAAYSEKSLEDIAEQLEYAFSTQEADPDAGESFATAVLVEMPDDPGLPALLINRGHPPPILLAGGSARLFEPAHPASLPLGLGALNGTDLRIPCEKVTIPPGSTLVLYTDGVSEARDVHGTFLDPVAALDPGRNDPESVVADLADAVTRHTGDRPGDDATILAIHYPAPAVAPAAGQPG